MGVPIKDTAHEWQGTFPLTTCPMRSIRLRDFWRQPIRA